MHSRILTAILVVFALSACSEKKPEWSADQQAVYEAMQEWVTAFRAQDASALWEMLSPDSKNWYKRELEGDGGLQQTVKMSKAALKPEARTTAERRKELEELLATLPDNADQMTPKDYYIWKTTPKLTQEGADSTARAFERGNIKEIEVQGDKATVLVKAGEPDRYSWVRHDGVWKFDLPPSILRALTDARKRETEKN